LREAETFFLILPGKQENKREKNKQNNFFRIIEGHLVHLFIPNPFSRDGFGGFLIGSYSLSVASYSFLPELYPEISVVSFLILDLCSGKSLFFFEHIGRHIGPTTIGAVGIGSDFFYYQKITETFICSLAKQIIGYTATSA
jgi:hypothetical protein